MGLWRSTFYDMPSAALKAAELLARIGTICDEFECYGYRLVGAALRHQGIVVNNKRLRRLMREHGLQPKRRRRYVVTTNSDHARPIFRDLAKDVVADRPNQLWVADLTYVAIPGGFVYLAAILDAWSRKVVGYAISRSMDARIAVAALKAAVRSRKGGSSLPGRLRDLRGYHRRPSALHRRGLQRKAITFRLGLSQPHAVRKPTRPADCQNSRLKVSTPGAHSNRGSLLRAD